MFAQSLEVTLNLAYNKAKINQHEFLTIEHLMLSLLENPDAVEVLTACSADIQRLRSSLNLFLEEGTPSSSKKGNYDTQPTLGFQRVLQRAIFQVQATGKTEVNGANVLCAIFSEQESQAAYLLNQEPFTRLDIINYINHGARPLDQNEGMQNFEQHNEDVVIEHSTGENVLEKYATNLNMKAKAGKIDPVIGREHEINRASQILCRRRKNNPLFVGEAGVGKTAIAEGIAYLIEHKKCAKPLENATIYNIDLGVLLAGTKYRGDFEKRLHAVLKELKKIPNAIIFIDEIHSLIGAGAASGGALDAANLVKPLLSNGELKCMGATTFQEYRSIFSKDKALSRRFQKIDIMEPTETETIGILKGLKAKFESFHDVKYSDESLVSAVRLSNKYITDRFLPDKAIDIIDEVGANFHMNGNSCKQVKSSDIERTVANVARIPEKRVSKTDAESLCHLERDISTMVFGQDDAIEAISNSIKISRSGLRDTNKPIGSFLFTGPTGVGKTEVALQLAKSLNLELIRFDMSEYMEKHSSSQLIGAPPGYVGFEQGGLLADAVVKNPHAVLLLDEIEKAHPEIFNLLLQVMDHATLTDNNGRHIDFRHIIIIMTSNTGASCLSKNSMGFTESENESESMVAVNNTFTPEFRNRLDKIVQFNKLTPECVMKIVDKFITQLEVQLDDKNISMKVSPGTKKWLCTHGTDEKMGARPMSRLIQEEIKSNLANEILFGKLKDGGKVDITLVKSKPTVRTGEKLKHFKLDR
ncbi:MAG: ATP-dependent Clp protease ATP-binding subunit ClpA [Legionellales bacterium]|nr:ATP-dependent Clp protease ATP-binding subunit ClpA [Legionellales bacterium]